MDMLVRSHGETLVLAVLMLMRLQTSTDPMFIEIGLIT